jgi:hypothetical protein
MRPSTLVFNEMAARDPCDALVIARRQPLGPMLPMNA